MILTPPPVNGLKIDSLFDISAQFKNFIFRHLDEGNQSHERRFVIGVSAGVDSMVLLDLAKRFFLPEQLCVAYFDHQTRSETKLEAQFVQKKCKKLGVKKVFIGKRSGTHLSELAMRKERLRFLEQVRIETKSSFIFLGHHANDQLETLLMRLIRGTGPDGLAGILPRSGNILRPLLEISKNQIKDYAIQNRIGFLEDPTNRSSRYFRNRVRHQVIPTLLEAGRDFGGEEELLNKVTQLAGELQSLRTKRRKWCQKWTGQQLDKTPFWWSIHEEAWNVLSFDEKRGVARFLWKALVGESLQSKEIVRLVGAISAKKSATLSGRIQIEVSCGFIFFISEEHRKMTRVIQNQVMDWCSVSSETSQLKSKLKNLSAELRFLNPGDTYQQKKMKKIIYGLQIPRPFRPLYPVVAKSGTNELLWFFSMSGELSHWIKAPWEKKF